MRTLRALLLLLIATASTARAEWAIEPAEPKDAPSGLQFSEFKATQGSQSVELLVVTFNTKGHSLAVMDNPEGAFTLASAAEKRGALAAINGGYFHANRTPLGLVVRKGKTLHGAERAKLLSGIVSVRGNKVMIQRAAEFKPSPSVREALQAGPFLVDGGKSVSGLNATRAAARSVVFTANSGHAGLLVCRYTTLAETSQILSALTLPTAGRIARALNLEGGSSTGLWVKGESPFYLREGKEVRNYLGIVASQ